MDVSKPLQIASIKEIKILEDVRLVSRHDLNPIYSKDNLRVQFTITGDLKGSVTCYLCLDGHELNPADKNYLFPLFVESMNILIGKQMSLDTELAMFNIKLSPPKLSMIATELNSSYKSVLQKYELELEAAHFTVLTEYHIEAMN